MGTATADAAEAAEVVDLRALPAGTRLRVRRTLAGLAQWEAAQRLGVAPPTLSLAESGRLDAARTDALDRALAALLPTGGGAPPGT